MRLPAFAPSAARVAGSMAAWGSRRRRALNCRKRPSEERLERAREGPGLRRAVRKLASPR
jgi:hypothetical protein